NCMVSTLQKYFRPRRDRQNSKKKIMNVDVVAVVTPASSVNDEKEVTIPSVEELELMPPAGGTEVIISEIDDSHCMQSVGNSSVGQTVLERDEGVKFDENGLVRPTIVESTEVIDPCGCPANLRAIGEIVNDVVSEVVQDVPPEVKEAACTSSLVFVSLAGLFFSIALYRYFRHLYYPEPEGYFCSTFSWLFAPLFDALCERQPPGGFFHEMKHESSVLYGEVQESISNFFQLMMDGFHALGVIFSKMFEGLIGNIDDGIEELSENVSENVSFLARFCSQIFYGTLHIFTDTISKCGQSVIDIFSHDRWE
uniref:Transmembrane protein n=1 Tax=Haemonchus contortus TaxID=6289 RepID=A0A7I5E9U8_HAECO